MGIDVSYRLSNNFVLGEGIRSSTAKREGLNNLPGVEEIGSLEVLFQNPVQSVRDHFGVPFVPNSAFRSLEVDCAVKLGRKNRKRAAKNLALWSLAEYVDDKRVRVEAGTAWLSQHVLGEAADIEIPGVHNRVLFNWIRENLVFDQLIAEYMDEPGDPRDGWVHVSYREGRNRMDVRRIDKTTKGRYLPFDGEW